MRVIIAPALGALIERTSDSFDLFATTFFWCPHGLVPQEGNSQASVNKIHPQAQEAWRKALGHNRSATTSYFQFYYPSGERKPSPAVTCLIDAGDGRPTYTVSGRFVPNRLTTDSNFNRRLDVLRCRLRDSESLYSSLANTDAFLTVTVQKDGVGVLKYSVSWRRRATGFMLEPVMGTDSLHPPWKGFDPLRPGVWTHDDVYMCVPGVELLPSQATVAPLVEFIQHHLLMGVQHIFMTALLGSSSIHMDVLKTLLRSFIDDGSLTLVSSTHDGFDMLYSVDGIRWGRDIIKQLHVNMCTYAAKGVANYVAVWDTDELFVPLGAHRGIMDVIRASEASEPLRPAYTRSLANSTDELRRIWQGGPGWADADVSFNYT